MHKLAILLACTTLSVSAAANYQDYEGLMAEWLSLEKQQGQLQQDWSLRKQFLEQRSGLLKKEYQSLKENLNQANSVKSEIDEKRLELASKQNKLEKEQEALLQSLSKAQFFIGNTLPKLPPPIQSQWQDKLAKLNQGSDSNSVRLESTLSLFKMAEEFNKSVNLHKTTMKFRGSGGQEVTKLVSQIFLGLSQGWYISNDGSEYGYGRPNENQWQWWSSRDAERELSMNIDPTQIAQSLAILENPTTADFVSLPVSLTQQ